MDEEACASALKEYTEAVDKYGLDNIQDYDGSTKAHMVAAFAAGFYAGRDHQQSKEGEPKKG